MAKSEGLGLALVALLAVLEIYTIAPTPACYQYKEMRNKTRLYLSKAVHTSTIIRDLGLRIKIPPPSHPKKTGKISILIEDLSDSVFFGTVGKL